MALAHGFAHMRAISSARHPTTRSHTGSAAAGAKALAAVAAEGENQCIALVGTAGAGKTFLARRLQSQLCAGVAGGSGLEELLGRGSALLDVFGSSLTATRAASGPSGQRGSPTAATETRVGASSCFCRATQFFFRMCAALSWAGAHLTLVRTAALPCLSFLCPVTTGCHYVSSPPSYPSLAILPAHSHAILPTHSLAILPTHPLAILPTILTPSLRLPA